MSCIVSLSVYFESHPVYYSIQVMTEGKYFNQIKRIVEEPRDFATPGEKLDGEQISELFKEETSDVRTAFKNFKDHKDIVRLLASIHEIIVDILLVLPISSQHPDVISHHAENEFLLALQDMITEHTYLLDSSAINEIRRVAGMLDAIRSIDIHRDEITESQKSNRYLELAENNQQVVEMNQAIVYAKARFGPVVSLRLLTTQHITGPFTRRIQTIVDDLHDQWQSISPDAQTETYASFSDVIDDFSSTIETMHQEKQITPAEYELCMKSIGQVFTISLSPKENGDQ